MTKIDEKLISKLEKLSKLRLNSEERRQITDDLTKIVGMFDKLEEVDTSNVEAMRHLVDHVHRLRNDIPANELSTDEALKNAPQTQDDFFAVPKFLKPK